MVSMGTVWDRSTEFLSDNLPTVVPIALATIFVPISIEGSIRPALALAGPNARIAIRTVSLLLSLLGIWGGFAITALVLEQAQTVGAAFRVATRRFPLGVLVGVVLFAAIALACLPILGVLFASGYDPASMKPIQPNDLSPGVWTFLIVYGAVIALVALWLVGRLALLSPVVVGERAGLASFVHAWRLTRGLAFKIIGVTILYVVVSTVAALAVKTVFGTVLRLLTGDEGTITVAGVLTAILTGAVQTAFSVLGTVFLAKLYLAARVRAEERIQA